MVVRGLADVVRRVAELLYGSDARWFREELAEASSALGVRFQPGAGEGDLSLASDGEETER
jgi:hypothetical protein